MFCHLLYFVFLCFFNVNEDEVQKYLSQFEDDLKNPNLYKPFNLNSPINKENAHETIVGAIQLGKEGNKEEMVKMLQKSSEFGNLESKYSYSICLENGNGVSIDKDKSLNFLKIAADKGNLNAMHRYGIKCLTGNGVKIDITKSIHYFKLAA